jgi:hypothetical protein
MRSSDRGRRSCRERVIDLAITDFALSITPTIVTLSF